MAITKAVEGNKSLLKVGLHFEFGDCRSESKEEISEKQLMKVIAGIDGTFHVLSEVLITIQEKLLDYKQEKSISTACRVSHTVPCFALQVRKQLRKKRMSEMTCSDLIFN